MSDAKSQFNQAVLLYRSGKIGRAMACFEQAIALEPKNPEIWFCKGLALGEQESYSQAEFAFQKALELSSEQHADAWHNLSLVFYNQKKLPEALQAIERALRLKPEERKSAVYHKALILHQQCIQFQGSSEPPMLGDALKACRKAIMEDSDNGLSYYLLGTLLKSISRLDEALATFQQLVKKEERVVHGWYEQAAVLALLLRKEEAIQSFKRASSLNAAYCLQAKADDSFASLHEDDSFQDLLASCEKELGDTPRKEGPEKHYQAKVKGIQDRKPMAEQDEDESELDAKVEALCHKAHGWMHEGRMEEALQLLSKLVKRAPDDFRPWSLMGMTFFELEQYAEAEIPLQRSLEMMPEQADLWHVYAVCLEQLGQFEGALEALEGALRYPELSNPALVWSLKGRLLARGNTEDAEERFSRAQSAFRRAIVLEPQLEQPRFDLGLLLLQRSDFEQAIEVFNVFILDEASPFRAKAYFFKAIALARSEDIESARLALDEAVLLEPQLQLLVSEEPALAALS